LTSFEAKSKGITVSHDLWLSERQALQHTLSDTLEEQDYMTETLSKMEENRAENQKLLKQKKSLIIKQISTAKSKVPKYLDDIEEKLK
jgi:hypothetical protein